MKFNKLIFTLVKKKYCLKADISTNTYNTLTPIFNCITYLFEKML